MPRQRQLNVYVPSEDEAALKRLRELSVRIKTPLNRLVLDAIAEYVGRHAAPPPSFRTFDLGVKAVRRADIYAKRLDEKAPR